MRIYFTYLLVILALAFGASVPSVAGGGGGAFKLEGAWVARVTPPFAGQWSYVVTSDPSGKRGTGHGSVDMGFKANVVCDLNGYTTTFEASDSESPILVSMVMTGPKSLAYNSVWYGLKDAGPTSPMSNVLTLIGTVTGQLDVVAPGVMHGTHYFALYYPDADANGDGFPDEGVPPACVFQLNTVDTRLPMP